MRPTSVLELAELLGGDPYRVVDSMQATGWAWDSREVKPGDLFLAIKGERTDGHDHVAQAFASGAVAAVVERPVEGAHILVRQLTDALARMAVAYRNRFEGPVIGITGSAGKTSTKEFIATALSPLGPVLKTEGNRNTEYTAPLLWSELTEEHKTAVVEMGMRGFGHIRHLAAFSRPTLGVVTNIGFSHMELVGSQAGVATAKGELLEALPPEGVAILPQDDAFLAELKAVSPGAVKTFGFSPSADCCVTAYTPTGWSSCTVSGTLDGQAWTASLPVVGRHMAVNAAAAVLTASLAGVKVSDAAQALAGARVPPLRMEIRTWNGVTILLDAYNASPASMCAAIEVLAESKETDRKYAVIGEMRELGDAGVEGHETVGKALADAQLTGILLFGPATAPIEKILVDAGRPYERATELAGVESFIRQRQPGDAVLVKGSRALEMERAVPK